MESNNASNRIHPLVAGAAISVMLVSLTGVAAITGLIPNSHSTASTSVTGTPVAAAVTTPASSSMEAKPTLTEPLISTPSKASSSHPQPRKTNHINHPPKLAQAPAVCHDCGRVLSVQAIQQEAPSSGVGMVAGAVLGGVLGNQVGGGNGRKIATVAGAVGGGYAGNEIEKRSRSTTTYQVRVRMEGGEVRTFPYAQQPAWHVGDRIRIVDGQLTSRA